MAFAINRKTLPLMALIYIHFLSHFLSFAIESYLYETNFKAGPIKEYRFKSSYNLNI